MLFVEADRIHRRPCIDAQGMYIGGTRHAGERTAYLTQIVDGRIHSRDILINKSSGLDFRRRLIRNEILAEWRQSVQRLVPSPEKSHMRREDLVARADQIVAIERLHVDRPMRAIVHGVQED